MHQLAGEKMHQLRWQEGPGTGSFSLSIRLLWDDPPACRNWDGVIGACSD
jgi:hypothetical protein